MGKEIFLGRIKVNDDIDCVKYIDFRKFECGHYFGGLKIHGAGFWNDGKDIIENLDNFESVLTKKELKRLFELNKKIKDLGYGIAKDSLKYKEGIAIFEEYENTILKKLQSEDNKKLFEKVILDEKEKMKEWAIKIAILGTALVCVIPFSIDFTQKVSEDYLAYVDETIAEANAGAEKIYEIKAVNEEEDTFLEKISDVFVNAYQEVKDLFTYFNNLTKRCINSIAIIMVITFVLPLLTLVFFRWLLKELFSLNLNISVPKIKEIQIVKKQ